MALFSFPSMRTRLFVLALVAESAKCYHRADIPGPLVATANDMVNHLRVGAAFLASIVVSVYHLLPDGPLLAIQVAAIELLTQAVIKRPYPLANLGNLLFCKLNRYG